MFRWVAGLRVALRAVLRPTRVERELQEEIHYHLERQIAEEVKAGLPPDEARAAAIRAMGAIEKHKDDCRDLRDGHLMRDFMGDLRYAARGVRRSPGFALTVILILSLGIGANTAVFSIINAVILEPLPYQGADRIVALTTRNTTTGEDNPLVTLANYRDWREQSASFEAMASYRGGEAPITPGDTAEYGQHANVDSDFFRVFAVEPVIGRVFSAEETAMGSTQPAAVISYSFWQSRFAGDANILQRTIRLGNAARPIVGVLPPGFHFPRRTDVWSNQPNRPNASRTSHSFLAVGRLKPNVSLEQAQAELDMIAAGLAQQHPESNKDRGVAATPLQDVVVGGARLTLYLLWGVVALVLLIACANTATLLLGKATARAREIAVRATLGASRRRIVRQLISESLLLALVAGVFGTLLAYWGAKALVALTPFDVIRNARPEIDINVLALTLAVTVLTSLLFGVVPALHASRLPLLLVIQQGNRSTIGGGMIRTRGALVVAEIALAVVLLTGAGLLIKSLAALHDADLGFQPQNVLVMRATGVRGIVATNAFFKDVIARISALPGVLAVGATSIPPGDTTYSGDGAHFIDHVPEQRDRSKDTRTLFTIVAPGTFAALAIPVKRGRDFNDDDVRGRPMVAIVNDALVRKSFGDQDPIGRTIFCTFDTREGMTIVGVVGDTRQRNPGREPMPDCIMPYQQHAYNSWTLNVVIRTGGDPLALIGTVRRLAAEVSPEVPVAFTTMEATLAKSVEDSRFLALLFAVFAALAVSLAMAGVYGVTAYSVQQRSQEIGLRMALGASQTSVLRLILEQGLRLAAIGLILGLAAAVATGRLLTAVLFEVTSVDAPVYILVIALLGLVTLVAGYLPARRAALLDPMEVLKTD